MPTVRANGIDIEYETFGAPTDPALLLVMGLGRQLVHWEEDWCRSLVERGLFVVRFDNRDVGLSTKVRDGGVPNVLRIGALRLLGVSARSPYTLDDMADDALGLLTALSIERAHVVGVSLGGMVAQLMALRQPDRVRSLCSWMSTPGGRRFLPTLDAAKVLFSRPPDDIAGRVDFAVEAMRVIGSPPPLFDEGAVRRSAEQALSRDKGRAGVARQLAAVLAAPPRLPRLRKLDGVPTVVLHGDVDPLVPHRAGVATARAVAGARLLTLPGVGHDMPRAIWPVAANAIVDNAARAR